MINVIIPISSNAQRYYDIVNRLAQMESVSICIGICQSDYLSFIDNVGNIKKELVHVFQDGSDREEIINALQSEIDDGSVMVLRKPITMTEFSKFVSLRKDIVTCDRKLSKFKGFVFMICQKLLKLVLGVKLYDGDPSVIYMGEEIATVAKQSGNLSYSTRVNRWRGIEQGVVSTSPEVVKATTDVKSNAKLLIFAIVCIILAAGVTTIMCLFVKMSIIIGLLIACLDVVGFAISLIMIIMFIFNRATGRRYFSFALEIDKENLE